MALLNQTGVLPEIFSLWSTIFYKVKFLNKLTSR